MVSVANEAFGYKEHTIYGAEYGNEESILNNLRKQMKLIGVLERVIEDYKIVLIKSIEERARILESNGASDSAK